MGPIKVHVDNKGIIGGLWRGERNCISPKAGDAGLSINICEELHHLVSRHIAVELEHFKARRTKKDKKHMSQIEKFVTEGNEKADELAKAGSMLHEGFMAEARAKTVQQEREEVYAALQYAASFHCLLEEWKDCEELKPKPKEKWNFFTRKSEDTKHRTEWCAEAEAYRCMRCGRGSKCMKMPGKCAGPEYLSEKLGKCGKATFLGGHDLVRRTDRKGEVLIRCRKCSGYVCEAGTGTKIDELLQAGASGHKRAWENVEKDSGSRRWQSSCKGSETRNIEGQKKENNEKRVSEACEQV